MLRITSNLPVPPKAAEFFNVLLQDNFQDQSKERLEWVAGKIAKFHHYCGISGVVVVKRSFPEYMSAVATDYDRDGNPIVLDLLKATEEEIIGSS